MTALVAVYFETRRNGTRTTARGCLCSSVTVGAFWEKKLRRPASLVVGRFVEWYVGQCGGCAEQDDRTHVPAWN